MTSKITSVASEILDAFRILHTRRIDISYCIALDPGGETGFALVQSEDRPWEIRVGELGPEAHHWHLHYFLEQHMPQHIVCESFDNRAHEPAKLIAPEYIGIVRLFEQELQLGNRYPLDKSRPVVTYQSPALGRGGFWKDNTKLRAYNLYIPGMRHARDAIRHYAYWRSFTLNDHSLLAGKSQAKVTPF